MLNIHLSWIWSIYPLVSLKKRSILPLTSGMYIPTLLCVHCRICWCSSQECRCENVKALVLCSSRNFVTSLRNKESREIVSTIHNSSVWKVLVTYAGILYVLKERCQFFRSASFICLHECHDFFAGTVFREWYVGNVRYRFYGTRILVLINVIVTLIIISILLIVLSSFVYIIWLFTNLIAVTLCFMIL